MSVTERASFRVERLEWSAADRISVAGRWHGVPEDEISGPVLVVHGADQQLRVPALWEARDGRTRRDGMWEATFLWSYDAAWVEKTTLELSSGLAVELPSLVRRRLYGRRNLEVLRVPQAEASTGPFNRLRAHTAAVVDREDVEAAREEARQAREETQRARKDLMNERDRAKAETSRMRDALMTSEVLAERAVKEKEAVNRLLKLEVADLSAAVASERKRTAEAGRAREEIQTQLATAHQDAEALGGEVQRLRAAIAAVAEERDVAVRDLGQLRETLEDEHTRTVAALRERAEAAERAATEAAERHAELERALRDAQDRSEVLTARLAAVREAVASSLATD